MTDAAIEDDYVQSSDALLDGGYALIGAVHSLVKLQGAATKRDLILAAASHALRGGDKTATEVGSVISQVWPGARTDQSSVDEALAVGRELNLMAPVEGLDGAVLWRLTALGSDDVDRQSNWVHSIKDAAIKELQSRAQSDSGRTVDYETAELWLERIVGGLIVGITASQDAYLGRVEHLVTQRLSPRGIDQSGVLAKIAASASDPDVVAFLQACAIAALDPLDPFGAELVSHITTGCVLHSYIAGRDSSVVLDKLGTPRGQRALLDTPILVDLIGPVRVNEPARTSIRAAVAAGWEVVACDHTLEELIGLTEREVPRVRESLIRALNEGVRAEWYASLVADQLPSYCIEALRDGTYSSIEQMIQAAKAMVDTLAELGVIVRPHFNDRDHNYVSRCKDALEKVLEGVGVGRSAAVIQRDADSMAMVWRRRRRETPKRAWPGGWIITPDRHMATAFRSLDRVDSVPLTLSLPQWTTILSVTVPPAEVVDLASAAAQQLVEEAMWLLPSRFPSDVAMELAKQISPDHGGSATDLRHAQLTLDVALNGHGGPRSATSMAAEVLESRNSRRDRQNALALALARRAQTEAGHEADAARRMASEQKLIADEATRESETSIQKMEALRHQLAWASIRTKRIVTVFISFFVGVALAIGAWVLGVGWFAILGALGGLMVLGVGGYRWCKSAEARLLPLLVGAGVEVISLSSALLGLFVGTGG